MSAATAVVLTTGAQSNLTYNNLTVQSGSAALAQRMIDNPNGFYFNSHTPLNAGGAVRGPLVQVIP